MKKYLLLLTVLPMLLLTGCGEEKTEVKEVQDKAIKENVANIEKELPDGAMEKSGENIKNQMAKMQEELPKTIKLLKVYKKCLSSADDKKDAIACYEKTDKMATEMGLEKDEEKEFNANEEFGDWSPEKKKEALADLETGLSLMNAMMGTK